MNEIIPVKGVVGNLVVLLKVNNKNNKLTLVWKGIMKFLDSKRSIKYSIPKLKIIIKIVMLTIL